jgi:hypothetical protein
MSATAAHRELHESGRHPEEQESGTVRVNDRAKDTPLFQFTNSPKTSTIGV